MTDTHDDVSTVTVTVNGTEIQARPGELLIDAAERTGTYIPRFCYHSRMKPVGMCRMCLVEVDAGRGPALQPSCMIPVADGMVVDTESDATKKAQDGVLEFLLINHPLDCPVCDKGGECPLQDQTIAYGPGESRFVEEKRHYEKPLPISDLVYLDRERCILCDRCTRFADDVAGDTLIHFMDRGNNTQVNTFPDEPFASYFSGNTVQICPVGALTAAPYRFKARPWDLEETLSTAWTDSVGSRITVQSSRNQVLRLLGVDADPVNWGWLSDKERFAFEALNSPNRITAPMARSGASALAGVGWGAALSRVVEALDGVDPARVGVIGGARLTNESQYAWATLAKHVIGTDNVDAQLGDGLPAELVLGLPRATIDDACRPGGTTVTGPPERASAAAAAIAAAADALSGGPVTVVLGRASVADSATPVVDAAAAFSRLDGVSFLSALRRGNVHGALDAGLAPGLLPGRRPLSEGFSPWGSAPTTPGMDTAEMLAAASAGDLDVLILLGADPFSDFPDAGLAARAMEAVGTVVAVETLPNQSTLRFADVVLPAAAPTEADGTFTNLEGRVSCSSRKVTPPGTARADWQIAVEIAARLGTVLPFDSPEAIRAELAASSDVHAPLTEAALSASPVDGVLLTGGSLEAPRASGSMAPANDAYSLRLVATRRMYDAGTAVQASGSSAGLPATTQVRLSPADFGKLGLEPGTPVKLVSGRGELVAPIAVDAGVPVGSAAIPANAPGANANRLIDASSSVTDVRVERA